MQRGELFAGRDLKLGLLKGGGFRRVVSPRGNGGVKADGDGQAADIDVLVHVNAAGERAVARLDEMAALYDEIDGVVAFVIEIGGHEERALFAVRGGQAGQPFAVVDDAQAAVLIRLAYRHGEHGLVARQILLGGDGGFRHGVIQIELGGLNVELDGEGVGVGRVENEGHIRVHTVGEVALVVRFQHGQGEDGGVFRFAGVDLEIERDGFIIQRLRRGEVEGQAVVVVAH